MTTQKQPKLYVLVGVPGSGKSTWVANQDWAKDCAYISTDKIVDDCAKKLGKTYSEVFDDVMPNAVNIMISEVVLAKEQAQDIIWDQTSTTVASRKRKFNMLPDYHAIAVVFCCPDLAELMRRLNSRPGKIIPLDVVEGMIKNFEVPSAEEGFKEIWYA
jgi:predicted kinase